MEPTYDRSVNFLLSRLEEANMLSQDTSEYSFVCPSHSFRRLLLFTFPSHTTRVGTCARKSRQSLWMQNGTTTATFTKCLAGTCSNTMQYACLHAGNSYVPRILPPSSSVAAIYLPLPDQWMRPPFVPDHVTNAKFYDNYISDCGELPSTGY